MGSLLHPPSVLCGEENNLLGDPPLIELSLAICLKLD